MRRGPILLAKPCLRFGAPRRIRVICDDLTFRLTESKSRKYFRVRSEPNSAQKENLTMFPFPSTSIVKDDPGGSAKGGGKKKAKKTAKKKAAKK
jgi:hypothetical protein